MWDAYDLANRCDRCGGRTVEIWVDEHQHALFLCQRHLDAHEVEMWRQEFRPVVKAVT